MKLWKKRSAENLLSFLSLICVVANQNSPGLPSFVIVHERDRQALHQFFGCDIPIILVYLLACFLYFLNFFKFQFHTSFLISIALSCIN